MPVESADALQCTTIMEVESKMKLWPMIAAGAAVLAASLCSQAVADTVTLKDGTVLKNCFVRDEDMRYIVWEKVSDIGAPNFRIIPRSTVSTIEGVKFERGGEFDVHPKMQDLTISHIEINPKLESLHGHVDYDTWGRPVPKGPGLPDLGERAYLHPDEVINGIEFKHKPGEQITMTAFVRNVGFVTAKPFEYVWLIDGKEIGKGKCRQSLKELQEKTFTQKWKWKDGMHTVTFKIVTKEPEIATINNELTDPLWGWGFTFVINPGRIAWWHQRRNSSGAFSFEDYYRDQIALMNLILAESKYPSCPDGIKARVRIDRIIWTKDVTEAAPMTTDTGFSHSRASGTGAILRTRRPASGETSL
jgi:hypothetical protein